MGVFRLIVLSLLLIFLSVVFTQMGRRKSVSKNSQNRAPPADINQIPENLLETILTHLPIREAARTSILSKQWRYKWTCLPKLVFDNALLSPAEQSKSCPKDLLYTIYKILLQRSKPILDFYLSNYRLESCDNVNLLLLYLSMNHVEKITLKFWKDEYKLPSSLFSCLKLTYLDVKNCAFKLPLGFKGFSHLVTLNFDTVSFDAGTFGKFLLSCPLLENLNLTASTCISFEISAPKLRILILVGDIDSLCFSNFPLLSQVSIYPTSEVKILKKGRVSGMIKFFKSLPTLEYLEMNYYLLKSLLGGSDNIPEEYPATITGLTHLTLVDICFDSVEDVLSVLCLVKNCPDLKSLDIEFLCGTYELAVEAIIAEECVDVSLNHLKKTSLYGISGTAAELNFIKFLLARSPVLECVTLEDVSENAAEKFKILKSVIRFKRASTNAEVVLI